MWMAAGSLAPVRVVVVLPGMAGFLMHINMHTLIDLAVRSGRKAGFQLISIMPMKMHNGKNLKQHEIPETKNICQHRF